MQFLTLLLKSLTQPWLNLYEAQSNYVVKPTVLVRKYTTEVNTRFRPQGSAWALPWYPQGFRVNCGYRWIPGTSEKNFWVPLGTGYRSNKKYRVSARKSFLGTEYRPENFFGTGGYRVLAKFSYYVKNFLESFLTRFLNYIFIIKAKNGFILSTRADFMVMMTKIWFKPIFKLISATNGPNEPPSGGYFKTQIRTLSH